MTSPHDLGRRRLLQGAAGGFAAGALSGGAGVWGAREAGAQAASDADAVDLTVSYPFYDEKHPPGVATKPQRHCVFMTFDFTDGATATDLQALLARWSAASAQLMAGEPIGTVAPKGPSAIAQDTGEAVGLEPAALTVTLGLGPGIFDERFGLSAKRPSKLVQLPRLPSDNLTPSLTGGDLSIQACADDPQVAYHAVRNLARMARGTVETKWTVMGFGRASAGAGQQTPRNLMGFKDGTRNIESDADRTAHVWAGEPGWMRGGTYQVVRKIQMDIEIWDADRVSDQEEVFGRTKAEGAPLGRAKEFDAPDFSAKDASGELVIPAKSHVALAAPENNAGVKILRRSYNYTDGINDSGQLDAGLLFVSYQNDPKHFVDLQTKLGSADRLNEYIKHVGSGVFAIPPAPARGRYIGQELFG